MASPSLQQNKLYQTIFPSSERLLLTLTTERVVKELAVDSQKL